MRSHPPQYPRSSTPLNLSPSLFIFFFPPFLPLSLFFIFFFRVIGFCNISTRRAIVESRWDSEKCTNDSFLGKRQRKRKEDEARFQKTHSSHLVPSVRIHVETDLTPLFTLSSLALVRSSGRAAAAGLKPLRLPRAPSCFSWGGDT